THEPSVITDRRLIGHHGLFNHEVKSIDIERLLSEQRKHDRCEKLQQKSNTEFANPSTKETGCLLDSTNEETVISNSKDLQTPRILNYSERQEKKTMDHRRNPLDSIMNNYSVEPLHSETVPFPHMHSSFETQKYFDGKSFFNEIPYFDHKCSFEPFSHVNFPLDSPSFRPVDLAHYPPSYMLEKGPILPTSSSFPSPEHWSFPPMRLY
ncbi:hypothetical protein NL108_000128, partial [Boleophthalmus pectinirostris]